MSAPPSNSTTSSASPASSSSTRPARSTTRQLEDDLDDRTRLHDLRDSRTRRLGDSATRGDLLDVVNLALEAKIAADIDDLDRAERALERTAHRVREVTELLRSRVPQPVAPRP